MNALVIAAGSLGGWSYVLCMIWLASAALAGYLAVKAGYSEKWGLGTGLLLSALGALIWFGIWLVKRPRRRSSEQRPAVP